MQDLVAIDSTNTRTRVLLVIAVIFALVFAWFAVRWQVGSMIAGLTSPDTPGAPEAVDLAIRFAPTDPAARWLRASIEMEEDKDSAVKLFEESVRLSPYDYRWRIELGRAYEQVEMPEKAEIQLRRAVELAPTYAFPRWQLGNFYLRQNRTEDAFTELRKAAENNQTYREQVFSLAWDYFDKDPSKVEQLAADTPDARANLALFFAARGWAADSLRIWNMLSERDKATNPQIAKAIAHGLFIQRAFPEALEFARQLGIDADARPETVTNGDFEHPIAVSDDLRFGWQIRRNDPKIDIAADSTVKHRASRSLKVSFRNYLKSDLYNIYQTIVVEPNKRYHLSFWVRTESFKTSAPPVVEILNANDDKLITMSKPLQTGTNDWTQFSVDINTPEKCSGITIRTAREPCGGECPIVGIFWYDDFELSRQ